MRLVPILLILLGFMSAACQPVTPPEELAATYVAGTAAFVAAVEEAVATGIAATLTSVPTSTSTIIPSATPRPSATATNTPTLTLSPTETAIPTITGTPEPTATSTPSAADIKASQLMGALRNLKVLSERMYSGLGGTGTGYISCSRELGDSVITTLEAIRNLPTFDDSLLSRRLIGANINYNTAREVLLANEDIQIVYTHCVNWIEAGKPEGYQTAADDGANITTAKNVASQAIQLAEAGLNN